MTSQRFYRRTETYAVSAAFLLSGIFLSSVLFFAMGSGEAHAAAPNNIFRLDGATTDAAGNGGSLGTHFDSGESKFGTGSMVSAGGSTNAGDFGSSFGNQHSIHFWFNGDGNANKPSDLYDFSGGNTCTLDINSSGHWEYYNGTDDNTSVSAPTDSNWHMMDVSMNSGYVTVWLDDAIITGLNGVFVGTGSCGQYSHWGSYYPDAYNSPFVGHYDDVATWKNYSLTQADVDAYWNASSGCEIATDGSCLNSAKPTIGASSLQQHKSDNTTVIGEGSTTTESTVVLSALLESSSTTDSLGLQVEIEASGTPFSGTPSAATSTIVTSNHQATTTVIGIANGGHHWQARAYDITNDTVGTDWFTPTTPSSSVDFVADVPKETYDLSASSVERLFHLESNNYDSANHIQDSSGSGNDLDSNASNTVMDGRFGNAIATHSYATHYVGQSSQAVSFARPFTLHTWVYTTSTPANDTVIFDLGYGWCRLFADHAGNGIGVNFHSVADSHTSLTPGTWHMLDAVAKTDNSVSVYLDGSLLATSTNQGDDCDSSGNHYFVLGGMHLNGNDFLNAAYDDSAMIMSELSSSTISALWNGGAGREICATACTTPQSFYAQVKTGARNLHVASSTTTDVLKTLPADWIIHVASTTNPNGSLATTTDGTWYKVTDPTDGVTGWMVASDTTHQYISSYDGGAQSALEASSSLGVIATKTDRVQTLIRALEHYYTNSDSSSSLYSSDDHVNISDEFSSSSPSTTFPESLVLGIAATESGASSTTQGTDNGVVGPDIAGSEYGNGIMQLTVSYQGEDVKYLQRILNSDPDTVVTSSTGADGSMGHETHEFGSLTENAVERFQTKYSLTDPAGVVATSTLSELNSILSGSPTSSIRSLIPSDWSFNLEQDRPYQQMGTEAYAGANPSIKIRFKDPGGFDNRTVGNDLDIPPCGNFTDPATSTFFEHCYLNTNPNGYATSSAYGQTFEYYADTVQSIYANVKGALTLLRDNYVATTTPVDFYDGMSTTTFSGAERSWLRDIWHYNGALLSTTYLSAVANQMTDFRAYRVGGTQLVATTTQTVDLVNKMELADANKTQIIVFSPVDPQIVDSQGRVVGMVDGKVTEDIPDSAYNPITKSAVVFLDSGQYSYQVVGTEPGNYGVEIITTKNGKATVFNDSNIPIQKGVIHKYTLDLSMLAKGEKGVTRTIEDSDGKINKVEKLGAATTTIQALEAADLINHRVLPTINYPEPVKNITPPVVIRPPVQISVPSSTPTSSLELSTTTISSTTLQIETSTLMTSSTLNL